MPKVIHFRNKCIGCNSCVLHSAEHWQINRKDGKSELKGSVDKNNKGIFVLNISEIDREKNERAVKDCPVSIIQVVE